MNNKKNTQVTGSPEKAVKEDKAEIMNQNENGQEAVGQSDHEQTDADSATDEILEAILEGTKKLSGREKEMVMGYARGLNDGNQALHDTGEEQTEREQLNGEHDRRRNFAAYWIGDELVPIDRALEMAHVVCDDLQQDYFDILDPEDEEDTWKILWDFNRMRVKTDIINTMINNIEDALKTIGDYAKEYKERREQVREVLDGIE